MPQISSPALEGIGYAAASSTDRSTFAPVSKQSGGLLTSSSVRTLTVAGHDVGGVAVYGTKPGAAQSPTFQDQFVVQLVNAVAGTTSRPRFVRSHNQVIALSTGSPAVAAWFHGNHVFVVYRQGGEPDLASLALGVLSTPPAG